MTDPRAGRRVGVNLVWLVPGVVGGSEEATVGAVRAALAPARAAGIEPVLFGLPALAATYPDLERDTEFVTIDLSGANRVQRVLAENTVLARRAADAGLALMHHGGGVVPPRVATPATVAIHDTQPLDLPQNFGVVKRLYLGRMIGASARRAVEVTVPSEFVRRQLVHHTGVDRSKVTVVPWSVPVPPPPTAEALDAVRAAHGLGRPFVLYPAISYPHKNHAVLLDAMATVVRSRDVDLVLTGAPGPGDATIDERSSRPDLRGRVHVLGRVPRADLDALVAASALVAVPSRYEGFGLPALEALVAGRPAVVADAGSLPEVVGDGALVVGPDDVDGWAEAITSVLDDESVAARLVAAGRLVAASCTPQRTATGLVDVWSRALDRPPTPGATP